MKCGHCKGTHPTVAEVKACFTKVKRSAPPPSITATATIRQRQYITSLYEQVGRLPDVDVDGLTLESASQLINRLKIERDAMPHDPVNREHFKGDLQTSVEGGQVPQGRYTVVFDEAADRRITLRFHTPRDGKWKGTQLVMYLYGPNNDSDYRRCGNWTGDGYRIWASYRKEGHIKEAVEFLVNGTSEDRQQAGLTYALASSNCFRCGRTLTVPVSIHRGLGPECAGKVGVA